MSVNNENLKRRATEDLKLDTEDLTCAVCLGQKISFIKFPKKSSQGTVSPIHCGYLSDLFESPIKTTKCGHNFCENCLLDVRGNKKQWSCPQCRKIHRCSISNLSRNFLVERFVEKFKKQAEQPITKPSNLFGTCERHNRALEASKFFADPEPQVDRVQVH